MVTTTGWTCLDGETMTWDGTLNSTRLRIKFGTIENAPVVNNDIVNKKYVDDAIAGEDLWDRTGTVLSPKTAGDDISTTGDIKLGGVASIGQDLDNLEFTDVSGSANVDWIGFGIMDFGAADITNVQD
ncbi:MAG: hypothetical protein CMI54_04280, partial [Parcubacteria group bacterium]|nr:hypothetical protein [Parcubacteria group bacterium]